MKAIVSLVFASLCVWYSATAQIPPNFFQIETSDMSSEESPILETLDELLTAGESNNAWFPGFKDYVRDNIRYPSAARETGLEGVVEAEAVVQTDGKLTNIQIAQSLSPSCDKEVVRMLSGMPAWNPARRDGKPFEQKIYLTVRFRLKPF